MVRDYLPSDFQGEQVRDGTLPIMLHIKWDTAAVTRQIRCSKIPLTIFLQYKASLFGTLHKQLCEESMKTQQMVFIDEVCDLITVTLYQFSPAFVSKI